MARHMMNGAQGRMGLRSEPLYRVDFTKSKSHVLHVTLFCAFFIASFLIPETIRWPYSSAVLAAIIILLAFVARFLFHEWRSRSHFTAAALANGERLNTSNWAPLGRPVKIGILTLAMVLVQLFFEYGVRQDLRSKIPYFGKFFTAEVSELSSFLLTPQTGAVEKLNGDVPKSLILRKSSIAQTEQGLYVWPAYLDAQSKVAILSSKSKKWFDIEARGDIPEFRFDPEVIVNGNNVFVWGGSLDDSNISSLKRRPFTAGSVLDTRTKIWSKMPSIPEAKAIFRSRLMQVGKSMVAVTLLYDKALKPFLKTYILQDDLRSWRLWKSIPLGDFNAVEIYGDSGRLILPGVLGQEGEGVLSSLDSVANSVMEVLDLATFEQRVNLNGNEANRFKVFDLLRTSDAKDTLNRQGALQANADITKGSVLEVEAPQGLNGANVVAHFPGFLALRGASGELVLCRFSPLECHRPLDSFGKNLQASAARAMGGRLYADTVFFWQTDKLTQQEYNFENRSLVTHEFSEKARKAIPLYVFSRGVYLLGQASGQDPIAEAELKAAIRSTSCKVIPFRSSLKLCKAG